MWIAKKKNLCDLFIYIWNGAIFINKSQYVMNGNVTINNSAGTAIQ